MIPLAALAVFSGLSANLLLSFALGMVYSAGDILPKGETRRQLPLYQLGVLFITVLFLWVVFTYALPPSWKGFSVYFLFFPLAALSCMGLEHLRELFFPKFAHTTKMFSAYTAYDGLVLIALIITFSLAADFTGALVLVLFFVLGNTLAMLALNEIRRGSTLEWVPRFLRGSPLILISMGLLSLISVSAAGVCFRILEVFP